MDHELKTYLDRKVDIYNQTSFITNDPICIPHKFSRQQDIEIAGLFAATLAWGNRTTILNSCQTLMELMDHAPYEFILQHQEDDLKKLLRFVHRTFNATDLLYFIHFLKHHYAISDSLEDAFVPDAKYLSANTGDALIHFNQYFFSLEHPVRTHKHVATPEKNSACKRLNMYLRWMVRTDDRGVDFGLWNKISPSQLVCPLDVHVARVAFRLGMLPVHKADWKNAVLLTELLKQFNADDPAVYDYALFGLGVDGKYSID